MHSLRAAWTPRKRVRPLPALPPRLGVATLPTLPTNRWEDPASQEVVQEVVPEVVPTMKELHSEIEIAASVEHVWDILTDLGHPHRLRFLSSVEPLHPPNQRRAQGRGTPRSSPRAPR